jgi:hypothetical protein
LLLLLLLWIATVKTKDSEQNLLLKQMDKPGRMLVSIHIVSVGGRNNGCALLYTDTANAKAAGTAEPQPQGGAVRIFKPRGR